MKANGNHILNLGYFPPRSQISLRTQKLARGQFPIRRFCSGPIHSHLNVEVIFNDFYSAISYLWQGTRVQIHMLITNACKMPAQGLKWMHSITFVAHALSVFGGSIYNELIYSVVATNWSCAEILAYICNRPPSRGLSQHLIDGVKTRHSLVKFRCLRGKTPRV